ncbi:MAG: FeoA domain-containing protein [Acidithiobacillus sp.]|nr:FeoA domain-containing protein [Acidithiobacillus sp.]
MVMGLRPGTAFTLLLGPDRRGVVLDSAGTRIALGREWLEQIQVRPLSSFEEG